MHYQFEVTIPTKIRSVETYRDRIGEIVFGQLKNAFDPYKLANIFFWVLCLLAIPMTIIYAALCLFEIVIDTVLLPISLIPFVRAIPMAIETIVWSAQAAIGYFSCTDQVYY